MRLDTYSKILTARDYCKSLSVDLATARNARAVIDHDLVAVLTARDNAGGIDEWCDLDYKAKRLVDQSADLLQECVKIRAALGAAEADLLRLEGERERALRG